MSANTANHPTRCYFSLKVATDRASGANVATVEFVERLSSAPSPVLFESIDDVPEPVRNLLPTWLCQVVRQLTDPLPGDPPLASRFQVEERTLRFTSLSPAEIELEWLIDMGLTHAHRVPACTSRTQIAFLRKSPGSGRRAKTASS